MTVVRCVEVRCDGPSPDDPPCPRSFAWTDYGTAADLRARMSAAGWNTGMPDGRDRCPDCRLKAEPGDG